MEGKNQIGGGQLFTAEHAENQRITSVCVGSVTAESVATRELLMRGGGNAQSALRSPLRKSREKILSALEPPTSSCMRAGLSSRFERTPNHSEFLSSRVGRHEHRVRPDTTWNRLRRAGTIAKADLSRPRPAPVTA